MDSIVTVITAPSRQAHSSAYRTSYTVLLTDPGRAGLYPEALATPRKPSPSTATWPRAPHETEGDKLLFVFDGGTLTPEQVAAISLQPDELAEYAYHAVADAEQLLIPRLARRVIIAAANARDWRFPLPGIRRMTAVGSATPVRREGASRLLRD